LKKEKKRKRKVKPSKSNIQRVKKGGRGDKGRNTSQIRLSEELKKSSRGDRKN